LKDNTDFESGGKELDDDDADDNYDNNDDIDVERIVTLLKKDCLRIIVMKVLPQNPSLMMTPFQ